MKMNNRIINIKNNNLIFFLNIFIFICILKFISLDDSEPDNILTRKKLSSIVRYSLNDNIGSAYNTLSTTPEGNLICSASFYQSSTMKYYYGLKSNGRPYFIKNNIETEFTTTDSDKERNEEIIRQMLSYMILVMMKQLFILSLGQLFSVQNIIHLNMELYLN